MREFFKMVLDRLTQKSNVDIARERGITIGENCLILSNPYRCFGSEPYLVEMGDHVEITSGCQFVTHDGAVWTLRVNPELAQIDVFGKITIGSNVFVGINSTILPGVTIGDNCIIIAAGSVVTKNIPSGEVWGGVPARRINTLDDYKRKAVLKADYTKGMPPEEKEKAVRIAHPEWFNQRNG